MTKVETDGRHLSTCLARMLKVNIYPKTEKELEFCVKKMVSVSATQYVGQIDLLVSNHSALKIIIQS